MEIALFSQFLQIESKPVLESSGGGMRELPW